MTIHDDAHAAGQAAAQAVYDTALTTLATAAAEAASVADALREQLGRATADRDRLQDNLTDATDALAVARARIAALEAAQPAPTFTTRIGVYNGNPSEKPDEKTLALLGAAPQIASSYYQPGQQALNVPYETARIGRGTSPLITLTFKSGPVTLVDVGNRTAAAEAVLTTYIAALKKLSEVDPKTPVYATIDHEFEVKRAEGIFAGITDAQYAAALSRFLERVHAEAPLVQSLYWYGYSREAEIASIFAKLTTKPKVYSIDPYRWRSMLGKSFDEAILSRVRWARKTFGADARVGISEFGAAESQGDESNAAWFTGIRRQLQDARVEFAVLFNRGTDPEGNMVDDDPLTATIFASEMQG